MKLHNALNDTGAAAWRVLGRLPLAPVALGILLLSSTAYLSRGYSAAQSEAEQQATLYARVLADHAARAMGAVNLLMGAAGARMHAIMGDSARQGAPDADNLQRTLADVTAGQPLVRSLSLVRADGFVLASSQASNAGSRVSAALFVPSPADSSKTLKLAAGRDLADASPELTQASTHQLLLLTTALPNTDGRKPTWLVAALNPEYFATQHELMLDSQHWRSAVLTMQGRLLAATSNFPGDLGAQTPGLASVDQGEFGVLRRLGADGNTAISAWRLTRDFPLRVMAELPRDEATTAWVNEAKGVALGTAAMAALILALGAAARRQRSERQRAEAEQQRIRTQLREHYEMTEQLVDAMAVPVFLTDLDANLLLANAAWVRLTGLDREPPTAAAEQERSARVQRLLESGVSEVCTLGSTSWAVDLPGADGALRETVVTKVALRGQLDHIRGVIGTVVDVTEYKQATRATESARRAAEAANEARAEFVANVTHELRTPLQSILGFAELGADRSEGQDKLQRMFHRVHQAGGRMLRLVDELLDMSRIGSTVGSIKLRMAPLAEPVREVVDELRVMSQKRALTVKLHLDDALRDAPCNIDATRLQQVTRNVLANAMRFAPEGTNIEVSLQLQDAMAVVAVRDHGPGIPAAELESIFEPFVQSSLTKDGSGGTGLGLAICRQIMKAHGGFIVAENHADGGAVFRFGVPVSAPASGADAHSGATTSAEHAAA